VPGPVAGVSLTAGGVPARIAQVITAPWKAMTELSRQAPAVRSLAMPADTNPAGDIFGGWILAQMDIAGGLVAYDRAGGRVATVAIEGMKFHRPVLVGDLVSCYAEVVRVGRTSLTLMVETWVKRGRTGEEVKVTEGHFTYVAIDEERRPRPVPPA
jgi:acyl-CoA thioesterase YciA